MALDLNSSLIFNQQGVNERIAELEKMRDLMKEINGLGAGGSGSGGSGGKGGKSKQVTELDEVAFAIKRNTDLMKIASEKVSEIERNADERRKNRNAAITLYSKLFDEASRKESAAQQKFITDCKAEVTALKQKEAVIKSIMDGSVRAAEKQIAADRQAVNSENARAKASAQVAVGLENIIKLTDKEAAANRVNARVQQDAAAKEKQAHDAKMAMISRMTNATSRLHGLFQQTAMASGLMFAGGVAGATAFVSKMLTAQASLENYDKAITALTGDRGGFAKLQQYAYRSPLSSGQVFSGARTLLNLQPRQNIDSMIAPGGIMDTLSKMAAMSGGEKGPMDMPELIQRLQRIYMGGYNSRGMSGLGLGKDAFAQMGIGWESTKQGGRPAGLNPTTGPEYFDRIIEYEKQKLRNYDIEKLLKTKLENINDAFTGLFYAIGKGFDNFTQPFLDKFQKFILKIIDFTNSAGFGKAAKQIEASLVGPMAEKMFSFIDDMTKKLEQHPEALTNAVLAFAAGMKTLAEVWAAAQIGTLFTGVILALEAISALLATGLLGWAVVAAAALTAGNAFKDVKKILDELTGSVGTATTKQDELNKIIGSGMTDAAKLAAIAHVQIRSEMDSTGEKANWLVDKFKKAIETIALLQGNANVWNGRVDLMTSGLQVNHQNPSITIPVHVGGPHGPIKEMSRFELYDSITRRNNGDRTQPAYFYGDKGEIHLEQNGRGTDDFGKATRGLVPTSQGVGLFEAIGMQRAQAVVDDAKYNDMLAQRGGGRSGWGMGKPRIDLGAPLSEDTDGTKNKRVKHVITDAEAQDGALVKLLEQGYGTAKQLGHDACVKGFAQGLRNAGIPVPTNIAGTGEFIKWMTGQGLMEKISPKLAKAGDVLFDKDNNGNGIPDHVMLATAGWAHSLIKMHDQTGNGSRRLKDLGSAYRFTPAARDAMLGHGYELDPLSQLLVQMQSILEGDSRVAGSGYKFAAKRGDNQMGQMYIDAIRQGTIGKDDYLTNPLLAAYKKMADNMERAFNSSLADKLKDAGEKLVKAQEKAAEAVEKQATAMGLASLDYYKLKRGWKDAADEYKFTDPNQRRGAKLGSLEADVADLMARGKLIPKDSKEGIELWKEGNQLQQELEQTWAESQKYLKSGKTSKAQGYISQLSQFNRERDPGAEAYARIMTGATTGANGMVSGGKNFHTALTWAGKTIMGAAQAAANSLYGSITGRGGAVAAGGGAMPSMDGFVGSPVSGAVAGGGSLSDYAANYVANGAGGSDSVINLDTRGDAQLWTNPLNMAQPVDLRGSGTAGSIANAAVSAGPAGAYDQPGDYNTQQEMKDENKKDKTKQTFDWGANTIAWGINVLTASLTGGAAGVRQALSGIAQSIIGALIPGPIGSALGGLVGALFSKKKKPVPVTVENAIRIAPEHTSLGLVDNPASRIYSGRAVPTGAAWKVQVELKRGAEKVLSQMASDGYMREAKQTGLNFAPGGSRG